MTARTQDAPDTITAEFSWEVDDSHPDVRALLKIIAQRDAALTSVRADERRKVVEEALTVVDAFDGVFGENDEEAAVYAVAAEIKAQLRALAERKQRERDRMREKGMIRRDVLVYPSVWDKVRAYVGRENRKAEVGEKPE